MDMHFPPVQLAPAVSAIGNTAAFDVDRYNSIVLAVTGTFSAANALFEGSLDGTNWFTVQAARTNANTVETSTGSLSAVPAYAWSINCSGINAIRVRLTAIGSGSQVWVGQRTQLGMPNALNTSTAAVTQSGTWSVTSTPVTVTTHTKTAAASTNATSVKTTAARLWSIQAENKTASTKWIKLYAKTSAPTVGTDIPLLSIPVPANGFINYYFGTHGIAWPTGLAYAMTGAQANSDTTALAASDLFIVMSYT